MIMCETSLLSMQDCRAAGNSCASKVLGVVLSLVCWVRVGQPALQESRRWRSRERRAVLQRGKHSAASSGPGLCCRTAQMIHKESQRISASRIHAIVARPTDCRIACARMRQHMLWRAVRHSCPQPPQERGPCDVPWSCCNPTLTRQWAWAEAGRCWGRAAASGEHKSHGPLHQRRPGAQAMGRPMKCRRGQRTRPPGQSWKSCDQRIGQEKD